MIGNVYKIIVNCSNEIYVGSTKQECRARWQEHKDQYKRWKDKKTGGCSAFDLFEKYGRDNCKIILIRQYKIVDKDHLRALEQLWINRLQPINKRCSFVIDSVLKKKFVEYKKKWYQDKLKENPNYCKENYQKLITKNPNYWKEKYQKDLVKNPNHNQEHYQKYGEKKREKITCEICNCEFTRAGKSQHERTKKHQNNLTKQQQ